MTVDEAIELVDQLLQPEGLTDLQESLFRLCWYGESYQEISVKLGYDPGYIRTVGSRLWQDLSHLIGNKVAKNNLHTVFRRYGQYLEEQNISTLTLDAFTPEFPGLPLNMDSPFYLDRSPVEKRCYQEVIKPGALIRIQAPKYMGKTSLLYRILGYSQTQDYQTLRLSFQEATVESFNDLNSFLRWLCRSVAGKLKLPPKLDDYWDDEPSFAKSNCSEYFEDYLLPTIDKPFVLALDDVERIFLYPDLAQDFFPLLRVWHEEAHEGEILQNLRLIVVHSTEVYVPLDIHQSPFNVGLPIYLQDWSLEQIQKLALKYNLKWVEGNTGEELLRPLFTMVGGHPYLVQLALYHLWEMKDQSSEDSLKQILQEAPTDGGIYGSHLRRLLEILESSPALCSAMRDVIFSQNSVHIPPIIGYKLQSMGLVNLKGNSAEIRYPLYQIYFRCRLQLDQ